MENTVEIEKCSKKLRNQALDFETKCTTVDKERLMKITEFCKDKSNKTPEEEEQEDTPTTTI